jgi:hypothetical protein
MKKNFLAALLLALLIVVPIPTMARVSIGLNINIPLPPLITFSAPPEVVVIPETDVYADPDLNVNMYFYGGWWWRPWQGRWYRSRDYNSGWEYYRNTPSFYNRIPSGWRGAYRNHQYKGNEWNAQRIPHDQLQQNWSTWQRNRYWEKQNSWGVRGLRSRTQSQQSYQSGRQQESRQQNQKETGKSKNQNNKYGKGNDNKHDKN